jgi:polyphenol oxidase
MWLTPKYKMPGLWMGITYGPSNRDAFSLKQRLPALQTPFNDFAYVHQVHGNQIIQAQVGGNLGKADAIVTNVKGLGMVIQTADCVPIFIIGKFNIAVVHAGWRGVAANIVKEILEVVQSPIYAIIGPCISMSNYEVGEEVVQGIVASGIEESTFVNRIGFAKPHVDLRAAVKAQLSKGGVRNIEIFPHCTFDDSELSSYRRNQKEAGRILSVIGYV